MTPRLRRSIRIAAWALAAVVAPFLLYLTAALIGGIVPANAGADPPREGVTIFVQTNGVHTWIMVPAVTPEFDWRPISPAAHIRDPRYAGAYLAIGFGNRDFYLNTPTWGDLSLRTAAAAAFGGGPSLMHVYHYWEAPRADEWQRPITLSRAQYHVLARAIAAGFQVSKGRTMPLVGRGYGPSDVFYESTVPYNFRRTCNTWTGEMLRAAGVEMGVWTPLAQSIMWRLD